MDSDHQKAMLAPNDDSVVGDFEDRTLLFQGVSSRVFRLNDKFMIETQNQDGDQQTFEVKYTFGHYPLQQYLIETEGGHVQAWNIAWDSRERAQGGQRWFDLQVEENLTPDHPFHWTNHFQNWNSRCADCHSTNVARNFDTTSNVFKTEFSEINVACEACHGAGSTHIELVGSDSLGAGSTGFSMQTKPGLSWQFNADQDIAQAVGEKNTNDIDMCGACHSLRGPLSDSADPAADYHQNNRLQLLNLSSYHADGQSREESFVLGSFLQSKMHHAGVTCGNCHNPHSGDVLIEGNGLCAQCHKPNVFDVTEHHHHEPESEGAQCVNCHMPNGTYMGVDDRRDHSFTIPSPSMSSALDVPNACTQCHADKDNAWANSQTLDWGVKNTQGHWAYLMHRAANNDILVTRPLIAAVEDSSLPTLVRASLLDHLGGLPSRVSSEGIQNQMTSNDPLIRRAGANAMRGHSVELRWRILSPYLKDENRGVRVQVADVLADLMPQLPEIQAKQLAPSLAEYRSVLEVSKDSVSTQLNIANLEMRLGNRQAAKRAFELALAIEPSYVPALLNFASYYQSGSDANADKERELLIRAIDVAADSGAAQHSLGLFYVRAKDYRSALVHLALSVEHDDAAPYYAYVHAVALENDGDIDEAITALRAANVRWPNQYEILMTLTLYLEKSGKEDEILPVLSALSQIAPGAPDVQKLVKKYGQ
jgi:tetratricopeptide (TPR) repeat protein